MRCQRAQQRLMAYHDGDLSRGAARRVEKHLESCTECGPLLERLRLADHHAGSAVDPKGMAGVPGMVPPDDRYWESFTARVLDRVEEDAATRAPESHKPRRNWNFIIPRMAPAFSIALVVLVAVGVLIKIDDPIPVPKAPVTYMESAPEKPENVTTLGEKELSLEKRDSFADSSGEEPSGTLVEETRENDGAFRSTAASVSEPEPKPEKIAALEILEEKAPVLKKGEALATPDVGVETPGAVTEAAPAPVVQEVLSQKTKDQEAVPSVPATMEGDVASIGEVEKADLQVPMESKLDQTGVSIVETEMSQAAGEPLTAPMVRESDLNNSAGRDGQLEEMAAVSQAEPPLPSETAGIIANEDVGAPSGSLTAAALKEAPSLASDVPVQTLETLGEQKEAVALSIPGAPAEESPTEDSKVAASGVKPQDSSVSSGETRNTFVSRQHYRGPEDQLIHARSLAEVRKFWESEQVLKDLLSQRPPSPLQVEASILLVKVLSSLNRTGEAQQILDDARAQFPASEMIQTFDLKQEGEGQ
ncbi:MAG: zf-HC2 domain-containing protein [bacterium]|nr:zf-HC2 domain-containing protein [bacterium]MDT8365404.1 zf-HC2 domain-containing protein [bacterium]